MKRHQKGKEEPQCFFSGVLKPTPWGLRQTFFKAGRGS